LARPGLTGYDPDHGVEAVRREARPGRNPQTGAAISIAASTAVKFKPAKGLREAVDGGGA
jgi:DNA-binding protein HU-beta